MTRKRQAPGPSGPSSAEQAGGGSSSSAAPKRRTARGRSSRARILQAAVQLLRAHGAGATSVDQILERAGAGKSQFYHYFGSKAGLVREVIRAELQDRLEAQAPFLAEMETLAGIGRWLDALAKEYEAVGVAGCDPIGCLALELRGRADEETVEHLTAAFDQLQRGLVAGLSRMRAAGRLRADADPEALAGLVWAAIRGGLLAAHARRDPAELRRVLSTVLGCLAGYTDPAEAGTG